METKCCTRCGKEKPVKSFKKTSPHIRGTISMTTEGRSLPAAAVGLRLARIDSRERLSLCEAIRFDAGHLAVETTLRRAAISGRVEIDGEIRNHFADVLDERGDIIETAALDRRSYSALKNHWLRCKVEMR